MEIKLGNFKIHHEYRFCLNCFRKFQLPLLRSILFKDIETCPECSENQQIQKNPGTIYTLDIKNFKQKYDQRLQIFLPHQFKQTTHFCVAGYEGSLPISNIRNFLLKCTKVKLHNVQDLINHISYLQRSKFPKFNITFSNIQRLQLKGENIQSIEFLQYFQFNNLEDLSLWDNNIVQLKSLTKCKFDRLSQIHLSHNRIKSIAQLHRSNIKNLEKMSLGFRQSPSFQDYKSLLKISSQNMKTIYLNYIPFIQFYDKSLRNKYPQIYIISLNNCSYSNDKRNL